MVLKSRTIYHIKAGSVWVITLVTFVIIVVVAHMHIGGDIEGILWVLFGAIAVVVLPGVFVHIWYTDTSKDIEIILEDNDFIYTHEGNTVDYSYDQVELILYNKSASYDSGYYILGIEPFRNLQIFTTDGKTYFITCLMYYNLDELVKFFTEKGITVKDNKGFIGFGKQKP